MKRGEFQLVINTMEEAGFGILQRADELKMKLSNEGLLVTNKKNPKKSINCRCDNLTDRCSDQRYTFSNETRFPLTKVLIYPTAVKVMVQLNKYNSASLMLINKELAISSFV